MKLSIEMKDDKTIKPNIFPRKKEKMYAFIGRNQISWKMSLEKFEIYDHFQKL